MAMGNCGFGMMWLASLTWVLAIVLLVSLIVLSGTAIVWRRRYAAHFSARA
jgi:hypothetical protein